MAKFSVPVEFECDLKGLGWITFEFRLGSQQFGTMASWMTPTALADLIQAIISLHQGASVAKAQMAREPDAYRWVFAKTGEQVHLRILLFEGLWSDEKDEEGVVVFGGRCLFKDFHLAVVHALARMLEKWGIDGYKEQWRSDFPMEQYETLRLHAGLTS